MTKEREIVYKQVYSQNKSGHKFYNNNSGTNNTLSSKANRKMVRNPKTVVSLCKGQSTPFEEQYLFSEIAKKWMDVVNLNCKLSTYNKYRNAYEHHIKAKFEGYRVLEINDEIIDNFLSELYAEKSHIGEQLSQKTIQDICSVMRQIIRYANETYGIIPQFSIKKLNVKRSEKEISVISASNVQNLCRFLLSEPDLYKIGVLISLYTGIRIGELCALQWKDISFADMSIHIFKTVQRLQQLDNPVKKTQLCITSPKSSCSNRVIPLPKALLTILYSVKSNENSFVLSGMDRCVDPRTMQYHFKKYLKSCGIEETNFHTLRHTFATHCIELGFDAKTLSEILGHSSVNITLNRYVHSSMKLKREFMDKLIVGE